MLKKSETGQIMNKTIAAAKIFPATDNKNALKAGIL